MKTGVLQYVFRGRQGQERIRTAYANSREIVNL